MEGNQKAEARTRRLGVALHCYIIIMNIMNKRGIPTLTLDPPADY